MAGVTAIGSAGLLVGGLAVGSSLVVVDVGAFAGKVSLAFTGSLMTGARFGGGARGSATFGGSSRGCVVTGLRCWRTGFVTEVRSACRLVCFGCPAYHQAPHRITAITPTTDQITAFSGIVALGRAGCLRRCTTDVTAGGGEVGGGIGGGDGGTSRCDATDAHSSMPSCHTKSSARNTPCSTSNRSSATATGPTVLPF